MLRREKVYAESEILKAIERMRPYSEDQKILDVLTATVKGSAFNSWNMQPFDINGILQDTIDEIEEDMHDVQAHWESYSSPSVRMIVFTKCINAIRKRMSSPKK